MLHKSILAVAMALTFAGGAMAQTSNVATKPSTVVTPTTAAKHKAKVHHVSHKAKKKIIKKTTTTAS